MFDYLTHRKRRGKPVVEDGLPTDAPPPVRLRQARPVRGATAICVALLFFGFIFFASDTRDDEPSQAKTLHDQLPEGNLAAMRTPVDDEEADLYADPQDFERYHADGSDQPIPLPVVDVPGSPHRVTENGSPVKYRFPFTRAQCSRNLEGREQDLVREMLRHSWRAYKRYGWGTDELLPLSRRGTNLGGGASGIGYTIIDTLDTFLITGLNEEAEEAIEWIEKKLSFNSPVLISVFEANIRVLGGLLSAYELTGRESLKAKAVDIGDRLARAFLCNSGGLPIGHLTLDSGRCGVQSIILSEAGSLQLEFFTLSKITGNWTYDTLARRVYDIIGPLCTGGLCPEKFLCDRTTKKVKAETQKRGYLGALGDSYYEYLPKYYLLTGRRPRDIEILSRWRQVMNLIVSKTTFSKPSAYLSNEVAGNPVEVVSPMRRSKDASPFYVAPLESMAGTRMAHYVCFISGTLALSSMHIGENETSLDVGDTLRTSLHAPGGAGEPEYLRWHTRVERDLFLAKEVGETCYRMHTCTGTGIAPDEVNVHNGHVSPIIPANRLRPEAVEAFFYLWRTSKDQKYREWGRKILESWCLQLSHPNGFAGLRDAARGRRPPQLSPETVAENRMRRKIGWLVRYIVAYANGGGEVDVSVLASQLGREHPEVQVLREEVGASDKYKEIAQQILHDTIARQRAEGTSGSVLEAIEKLGKHQLYLEGVVTPKRSAHIHGSHSDASLMTEVMETFWLGESLKYMFLLFSDDDVMDLREWVFNTEAHPFRIVKATS